MNTKKGFTLLELLIVIGILAILSTTIVLVINPAELLRKARDSQRISDLNTMKTAIAYYVTEEGDPYIGDEGATYSDVGAVTCFGEADAASGFTTDGNGWIPVKFNEMTGGSPIAALPSDPIGTTETADPGHYYVYGVGSETDYTFKLVANMESAYYSENGDGDVESTDGGTHGGLYEVGTAMTLRATPTASCYVDEVSP